MYHHAQAQNCSYQISELNCNTAIPFAKHGKTLTLPPFVEIELLCLDEKYQLARPKRSLMHHLLDGYHLVIWDRDKLESRVIVEIASTESQSLYLYYGPKSFATGFYNSTDIDSCMDGVCGQWLPASNFNGDWRCIRGPPLRRNRLTPKSQRPLDAETYFQVNSASKVVPL